ncbi:hypothetical protein O3M35_006446 [Rhynocoris fuscipes]|uniref:Uncharacterized protein n=1 Tax=Rhynocoris fuscipes TaxID=488301 RepID=A0AAW1DKT4_9HEMI
MRRLYQNFSSIGPTVLPTEQLKVSKFVSTIESNFGRELYSIKLQHNTFRIRTLNVFCATDEVASLLSRSRPKD